MPEPLRRGGRYGWCYLWGREQRVPSKKYQNNYEQIKWKDLDLSDCPTRKTRFGKAKVKVFA